MQIKEINVSRSVCFNIGQQYSNEVLVIHFKGLPDLPNKYIYVKKDNYEKEVPLVGDLYVVSRPLTTYSGEVKAQIIARDPGSAPIALTPNFKMMITPSNYSGIGEDESYPDDPNVKNYFVKIDEKLNSFEELANLVQTKLDNGEFVGAQGPKGEKGDRGETGAQGPQGIQGIKGDTGAKGEKGDKGDKGEPGDVTTDDISQLKEDLDNAKSQLSESINEIINKESYPNLLDKNAFVVGKQFATPAGSEPTELIDNPNTTVTNIIDCDGDEYFETNLKNGHCVICGYIWHENKWYRSQFISELETEGDHYKFKINTDNKKIRIYFTTSMVDPSTVMVTKYGNWDANKPQYYPKGKITLKPNGSVSYDNLDDNLKTKINSIPSQTDNNAILGGKKIVGIGDSIMIGVGSGAIGSGGFLDVLKSYEENVTVVNMGVGSTTIQKNDNVPTNLTGKCILDRLNDIPNDADIIILEGGINDYYHQEKYGTTLGTYEENRYKYPLSAKYENDAYSSIQYVGTDGILQDNNFCGAFELCLIKILVRFIGKPFIYVIPHNPVGIKDIDDYFDIAKIICKKYGVPCLDLREVACMPRINVLCGKADGTSIYTVDNVHPSRKGYEVHYAPLIYNFLKTIIL